MSSFCLARAAWAAPRPRGKERTFTMSSRWKAVEVTRSRDMKIQSPQTKEDLERFAHFGHEVYRDHPGWVPPDAHHIAAQLSGDFAGADQTQFRPFWALGERGEILATVAA